VCTHNADHAEVVYVTEESMKGKDGKARVTAGDELRRGVSADA
jgi:hypothetical protein